MRIGPSDSLNRFEQLAIPFVDPRLEQGVAAELEDAASDVFDHLAYAVQGPPKGPFPSLTDLGKKFPLAGLPKHLAGTTVDKSSVADQARALGIDLANDPGGAGYAKVCDVLMQRASSMGLNAVRLAAFWDEIQPNGPTQFDFSKLDAMLAAAHRYGIKVVMCVGAKGPERPEFHLPVWAGGDASGAWGGIGDAAADPKFAANVENYVSGVAAHLAGNPDICMWQVENEPFYPIDFIDQNLDPALVSKEIGLLRSADGHRRPVMINVWSAGSEKKEIEAAFQLADVVGLDSYRRIGSGPVEASGPLGTALSWDRTVGIPAWALRLGQKHDTPVITTELQADRWGKYQPSPAEVIAQTEEQRQLGLKDDLFWQLRQNIDNGDPVVTPPNAGVATLSGAEQKLSGELLSAP